MRPVVLVSSLVPVLLALAACCPKQDPTERIVDFDVTRDELDAVLVDGELTAEACEDLCIQHTGGQVESVESCGQVSPTASTAAEPADTGDVELISFRCTVMATDICIGGRDHDCLDSDHQGEGSTLAGAWLGAQAHAEATSVKSFVSLARELGRFGAPADLVERARRAARDEVAHARMLRKLAAARGGRPGPIAFAPVRERSLLAFAIENAVEGCVNETWAALVAAWQAGHAEGADVRAAYERIAADEARHGDLAWAIDAWVAEVLTEEERAQVVAARREAVQRLFDGMREPRAELVAAVGLPSRDRAETLLRRLDEALWSAAA